MHWKISNFYNISILDNEILFIHHHKLLTCTLDTMASFRIKYSMFWAISEPYLFPRTFWAWKKAHFLSILLISNLYSVALCCLNVDLPQACHKHTSKLSIALSPMSVELLDCFLEQETWFFLFAKSHARFVAKGLRILKN